MINIFPYNDQTFEDKNKYREYNVELLKNIYDDKEDRSSLMTYIFDIMPIRIVKLITGIFEGEDDPDRKLDLDQILTYINTILGSNTTVPLGNDTSMIMNLNEIVYPYFKDYFEIFVKGMKTVIDNYMASLFYQCKIFEIFELVKNHL